MESGEIPEARNGQRRTAQPAASCASPNSKMAAGTTKQRRANRAVLLLLLGAGVVLYSSNSLLLILAKGQNNSHFKFHLSSVILLSEVLRGFGALVLVAMSGSCQELCDIFSPRLVLFAVPAAIYALEDHTAFLCAEYMDAGTFQTLSSLKILTTAIMARRILGHHIARRQWIALTLLSAGTFAAVLSHIYQASNSSSAPLAGADVLTPASDDHRGSNFLRRRHGLYDFNAMDYYPMIKFSGSKETLALHHGSSIASKRLVSSSTAVILTPSSSLASPAMMDELEQAVSEHRFFITKEGMGLVVLYSLLSAVAAVYSEWLLRGNYRHASLPSTAHAFDTSKTTTSTDTVGAPLVPVCKKKDDGLGTKMVKIYLWGLIFSTLHSVFELMYEREHLVKRQHMRPHLTEGFTFWTWVLVLNQALLGLVMTSIIRVAGAITKLFILPVAMVVTTLATMAIFDLHSSFMFFVAVAIICVSILMYNHEEHKHSNAGMAARELLNNLYPYFAVLLYGFVVIGGFVGIAQIHKDSGEMHSAQVYKHKVGLH